MDFKALQIANEQRNAHGLQYNDFDRYRKHCANRTHRLRSSLKLTHGKGREFKKPPQPSIDNLKEGHLNLLLFEAERAWAYAQALNTASLLPVNNSRASALRHSATGRFRRAIHWSTQLLKQCQSLHAANTLPTSHLLQATIYTLLLEARFLRFRDKFSDAVRLFCVARDLLDELLGAGAAQTSSRDKAVLDIWADGVGPEIRYCAHELGWEKAWDVESFVKALGKRERDAAVPGCADLVGGLAEEEYAVSRGKGKSEGRQRLEEVMWEGQPVPVRNPELVDVLLKVQDAEARLGTAPDQKGAVAPKGNAKAAGSKKGVAAYDAILNALSDAEEVARKLAEAQQLSGGTTTVAASNGRDIHFLHAFITYQLLSRRIQRDLLLVSALISSSSSSATTNIKNPASNPKRPQVGKAKAPTPAPRQKSQVDGRLFPAVVKLLDTILQSLGQMRTLSLVDDGIEISMAVDARLSFTRAKRCLYLTRCYIPVKKYAESLTLIQHANIHLRETRSILSSDPTSSSSPADYFYSLTTADLDALESELFADGLQFKKDWFLYNGGASTSADREAFQKPLFFDIALNYVQLDVDRLQERAGKKKLTAVVPALDKQQQPVAKAKAEVEVRPTTPELQTASLARGGGGGLATLLGGWWGRK